MGGSNNCAGAFGVEGCPGPAALDAVAALSSNGGTAPGPAPVPPTHIEHQTMFTVESEW